jgi:restriction system protein
MAIPTYEEIMSPLMNILGDQQSHTYREIVEKIETVFNLSEDEKTKRVPSDQQTVIENRTGWARTHLKKAGCVEYISRGVYRITPRGSELLAKNPNKIDNNILRQFPEFVEWFDVKPEKVATTELVVKTESETPDIILANAYQTIRKNLAIEVLETVKSCSPSFFEKLVVDLLVKMGYGGTLEEAVGQVVGKSGDGGIDGIINEDRLGLDVIYLQAKRWENVIGRPEIQKFAGALQGRRAKKGVFITTSYFTNEAKEFADFIDTRIVLIDGKELAELMIDYNVGVSVKDTFVIKRIDSDYFIEE